MEIAEFYSAEFLNSDEFYKMFEAEKYIDMPIHGRSEERHNEMDVRKFGKDRVTVIKSFTRDADKVYINKHEVSCECINEIDNKDGTVTLTLNADVDIVLTGKER